MEPTKFADKRRPGHNSLPASRTDIVVLPGLQKSGKLREGLSRLRRARFPSSPSDVTEAFADVPPRSVWIARDAAFVNWLGQQPRSAARTDFRLIVLSRLAPSTRELTGVYFRHVLQPDANMSMLAADQLLEVLDADNRRDLFVAGLVDEGQQQVLLYRGDLDPLTVPVTWFAGGPKSPVADPDHLQIADYGHTVRLGAFEAAADAILYEHDRDYRRRTRRLELESDATLGGSIRRLRLQRGLARGEFPVSEKTIARVERNDVQRPRAKTLAAIAETLGVPMDELASY
jgi:hypothetical protein